MDVNTQNKNWCIYKITNPNNNIYIGITSNFNKRMSTYKSNAKTKTSLIYSSMKKYGYDAHKIEIIDSFISNISYAAGKEIFWIRSHMSNRCKYPEIKGLNLSDGGGGMLGNKPSEKTKEKLRQHQLGKKLSEETKIKIGKAGIGRKPPPMTEEHKNRLLQINIGRKHTQEAKNKIGIASKGNKYRLGHYLTEDAKQHLSKLNKGKKLSNNQYEAHCNRVIKACGKSVMQYDLNGNFIKEYQAVSIAAKEIKIPALGIYRNVKGIYNQSRGFVFKYKNTI